MEVVVQATFRTLACPQTRKSPKKADRHAAREAWGLEERSKETEKWTKLGLEASRVMLLSPKGEAVLDQQEITTLSVREVEN